MQNVGDLLHKHSFVMHSVGDLLYRWWINIQKMSYYIWNQLLCKTYVIYWISGNLS